MSAAYSAPVQCYKVYDMAYREWRLMRKRQVYFTKTKRKFTFTQTPSNRNNAINLIPEKVRPSTKTNVKPITSKRHVCTLTEESEGKLTLNSTFDGGAGMDMSCCVLAFTFLSTSNNNSHFHLSLIIIFKQ